MWSVELLVWSNRVFIVLYRDAFSFASALGDLYTVPLTQSCFQCSGKAVQASSSYGPWVPPPLLSSRTLPASDWPVRGGIKDTACPVSVRVPGEIKRSRDLRGGRWSWTLNYAQKRSWVGRWSWAEQVGRLLLQVVQVVRQQQCNGHCLSDCPAQQLKQQLHSAQVAGQWRGDTALTLPLFWRRSTVSLVFFGRFPRSSLSLSRPLPTLSPSLIGHLASVDVKQHESKQGFCPRFQARSRDLEEGGGAGPSSWPKRNHDLSLRVVLNSSATDIVLVTLPKHSSWHSNCAVH